MQIEELVQAVATLQAEDAFRVRLAPAQWFVLGSHLVRQEVKAGDLLVRQGDNDRTMYFLGQGSLQVFATGGPPGSNRIAILRPGSVVGEPGLFGDTARMANVEAMTPCVVWSMPGAKLDEIAVESPLIAFELLRAAGGVMAARMRANLARHTPIC